MAVNEDNRKVAKATGKDQEEQKKVRPYPIAVSLKGRTGEVKAKIVKLVEIGFLIETHLPLKVGHRFEYAFEIPVMHAPISGQGVIVKTHDQFRGELGEDKNYRIAEIHFIDLEIGQKRVVTAFLKAIGQTEP